MPVTRQSVTLVFQDPSGQPIANGSVSIRLQFDVSTATSGGPQVSAGRTIVANLDGSGSVTIQLWPNSSTLPANSVYFVTAYTSQGQSVWSGTLTV